MRLSLLVLVTLFLGALFVDGCATTRNYESELQQYAGKTKDELITEWGVPAKEKMLDDGRMQLTYYKKDPTIKYVKDHSTSKVVRYYDCETKFTLTNQKVTAWQFEGPNCRK